VDRTSPEQRKAPCLEYQSTIGKRRRKMRLTITELQIVQKTAYSLRKAQEEAGRRDKILEDIAGLKLDIIDEIGFMYPVLIKFLLLLENLAIVLTQHKAI